MVPVHGSITTSIGKLTHEVLKTNYKVAIWLRDRQAEESPQLLCRPEHCRPAKEDTRSVTSLTFSGN